MDWLNYHHLYYFWTVAKEGGIARAGEKLLLSGPTISSQLKDLEATLGEKLFERAGRNLVLTDVGRTVFRYADEIFSIGREMVETVRGRPGGGPRTLLVGVADVLPKLIVYRLLLPALGLPEAVRMVCYEETPENLLAELSIRSLDCILSDSPVPPQMKIRAFSHLLGSSGVSVFGPKRLAAAARRDFPRGLDGAPFLLPTENTALRRSLDSWFDEEEIIPRILGEFEDSALLHAFGIAGTGFFVAPTILEPEIKGISGTALAGRIESIQIRFYVISIEKKLKHPAVVAITEAARQRLFA